MDESYIHLDVLFRQMQPEVVLENITAVSSGRRVDMPIANSRGLSEECYRRFARGLPYAREYTEDELIQRYRDLKSWLRRKPRGGVFSLLAEYGLKTIRFWQDEPLCRQEMILEWRQRTLCMGQDAFICAALAARDVREHHISKFFSWPPAVRTDNLRLWGLLDQGMAENHFHLHGSTQIFPLTWGFLMNFPSMVDTYFADKRFRDNLQGMMSYGVRDNKLPWRERIRCAAWIREALFRLSQGSVSAEDLAQDFRRFQHGLDCEMEMRIGLQRYKSAKLEQKNGKRCALDYAIICEVAHNNQGPNRFLAGERYFLFRCFLRCFRGESSDLEQDLLYLYLLLKRCLREELIQANGRPGFRNFADYQDRKGHVWDKFRPYWEESFRLSIASALTEQEKQQARIRSLELRVMPKPTARLMIQTLDAIDRSAEFHMQRGKRREPFSAQRDDAGQKAYFYVIHFAKTPLEPLNDRQLKNSVCLPRNQLTRQYAKRHAKAMAQALSAQKGRLCSRIRGIDACSHEIGCRPETFATDFRYLRQFVSEPSFEMVLPQLRPRLGLTYHVGEDFLCITDGLRAIDEAVCFLNMERGDRLGHGLALGISPEQYYQNKSYCVFLPAQDLLDNLVWLLYRGQEWNVDIPPELRVSLKNEAHLLLRQIYGDGYYDISAAERFLRISLEDYYNSWKLRGDSPEIYRWVREPQERFLARTSSLWHHYDAYERAKLDDQVFEYSAKEHYAGVRGWLQGDVATNIDATGLRDSLKRRHLLFDYHYSTQVRKNGEQIRRFQITPSYIALIRRMQDCLMERLMKKGIAIECNPSSNVLISLSGRYASHPIFRFNCFGLPALGNGATDVQLEVSVNTDDQGVFDTTLEYEYGLLFGGLQSLKRADGTRLIDNDSCYTYLDHLREMGNYMIFPAATEGPL